MPLFAQDSPKALVDEAEQLLRAGRLDDAARRLSEAAERFDSVRALLLLSRLEGSRGDLEAAVGHLEAARLRAPSSEEVLSEYARANLAADRMAPAISALEALVRMHPSVPDYHYMLGVASYRVEALQDAREALEEARRRAPRRPLTLIALGMVYNRNNFYDEARNVLEQALALMPGSPEALAVLAETYEGLGDLAEAESLARRALEDATAIAAATANLALGMSLRKQNRLEEARDALLAAIGTNEEAMKAHYQLSLVYARLGDREKSKHHREIYQQTLERNKERFAQIRKIAGLREDKGGM